MDAAPKRQLSVFDSVCIIVGIIVGAGIYETVPTVAASMGGGVGAVAIWLAGGLLALCGAFCYAELATTYPQQGGDFIYLGKAYGGWAGFLFGWSQLMIIRPGDIALMAFIFARYAQKLYPLESQLTYVVISIASLTVINILGVRQGKWTQNILTVLKIAGLTAIIAAGLFGPTAAPKTTGEGFDGGIKLALILVLFTFGGWHEMVYVAAEVKDAKRNIARAIVGGTLLVTGLYVLVNFAFLRVLGYAGMAGSEAIAVDALSALLPEAAGRAISVLICISTLGVINGQIFTGARISYAMGQKHRFFGALGKWNQACGTPIWALLAQGGISIAIVIAAGSFIDAILYTASVAWLFFLATGLSVFILRRKEPDTPRPYKASGFPVPPVIYCACCLFMIYSSVSYALDNAKSGLIISWCVLLAGLIVYWLTDVLTRGAGRE